MNNSINSTIFLMYFTTGCMNIMQVSRETASILSLRLELRAVQSQSTTIVSLNPQTILSGKSFQICVSTHQE